MAVAGNFRKEGAARAAPGLLSRDGNFIRIHHADDGSLLGEAERRDLSVSARVGAIPRQVELPGAWTFETDDNDGVDALIGVSPSSLLSRLETFGPHLIGFAVAAVIFVVGFYRFGLPVLTQMAVDATPTDVEETIAAGSVRTLESTLFAKSEIGGERLAAVQARFDLLVEAYEALDWARDDIHFELLIRKSDVVGANALAFPAGTIVVTDGLLDLIEDDDQVAAVLAHEIAHVHHRHGLYGLYRSAGIGGLLLFLGGDLNALVEDMIIQGSVLSNLATSRSMESEADATAVPISLEAGVDPLALVEALEALTGDAGNHGHAASWLSSHPATDRRAERIGEVIEAYQQGDH